MQNEGIEKERISGVDFDESDSAIDFGDANFAFNAPDIKTVDAIRMTSENVLSHQLDVTAAPAADDMVATADDQKDDISDLDAEKETEIPITLEQAQAIALAAAKAQAHVDPVAKAEAKPQADADPNAKGQQGQRSVPQHSAGAGAADLASGVSQVVGIGLSAVGGALMGIASAGRAAVLPRISEYRASQVRKMVTDFGRASNEFWDVPALRPVRQMVEATAVQKGVSFASVVSGMRPNGEYHGLSQILAQAIDSDPAATPAMAKLAKTYGSWVRQREKSASEMQYDDGSQTTASVKRSIHESDDLMRNLAANVPLLPGEGASFVERMTTLLDGIKTALSSLFTRESKADAPAPSM